MSELIFLIFAGTYLLYFIAFAVVIIFTIFNIIILPFRVFNENFILETVENDKNFYIQNKEKLKKINNKITIYLCLYNLFLLALFGTTFFYIEKLNKENIVFMVLFLFAFIPIIYFFLSLKLEKKLLAHYLKKEKKEEIK
jgi:hypothetical protein